MRPGHFGERVLATALSSRCSRQFAIPVSGVLLIELWLALADRLSFFFLKKLQALQKIPITEERPQIGVRCANRCPALWTANPSGPQANPRPAVMHGHVLLVPALMASRRRNGFGRTREKSASYQRRPLESQQPSVVQSPFAVGCFTVQTVQFIKRLASPF